MVNNNTQQNTNKNTSSVSESLIYLTKENLPKNVSYFKNDAGYISSSALSLWLKEHSYLSKDDIENLISAANITVVESVNNTTDIEAINRLESKINNLAGEFVAIKDRLNDVEVGFISIEKEGTFASKNEVHNISDRLNSVISDISQINVDLSKFANKSEIPTKISQLDNDKNFLTEHQSLTKYAKKTDIPDISGLAKKSEIPSITGLASKDWVNSRGYLTKHQSLTKYAKKTDIPDVSEFVTQRWIQDQNFLTDKINIEDYVKREELSKFLTQLSLDDYAKKNSVYDKNYINNNFISRINASNIYLSQKDAAEKYITKDDVKRNYLSIEDYRGLSDATLISDEYKKYTINEFKREVDLLKNGFYIVNYQDVVIVKDHDIMQVFRDGAPEPVLRWRYE